MREVLIPGPAGKIEAKYHQSDRMDAPLAVLLHAHPHFGGSMDHQIMYQCYYMLSHRGYTVARFNFRGVGKSAGEFDHGDGELADAASVVDWMQDRNPGATTVMVCGFSFGAWIAMQMMARRPEVTRFIAISPPSPHYDFGFLSTDFCQARGLVVNGELDAVSPAHYVEAVVKKLNHDTAMAEHTVIPGANHFFDGKVDGLMRAVSRHLDNRSGKRKVVRT